MSGMNSSVDRWSVYSAAQNLSAVLNNPNLGKQSNFFIRTWGDSFVEKTETEKSPYLPEIKYSHFEKYLLQYGKRIKRHKRLLQYKTADTTVDYTAKEEEIEKVDLKEIPELFLKPDFKLVDSGIFSTLFRNGEKCSKSSTSELIEDLSRYLDIVEMQIAKHVSQKSEAFFHTMTSHDTIMEKMKNTCKEVHKLRGKLQKVDQLLAKDPLYLIGLRRNCVNQISVFNKLKLMSTVLQTQPNIQLLLSSSDYVSALELIANTQKVLANELAGVTSLRYLPQQLKEMLKLIDKMLHTEFEKYAAADLHRPIENCKNSLETDHLVSLVSGLLRQNHTQFLEIYKQESITAAQTLLKQFMAEALADVEDDQEQCLRGSGEVTLCMDATHWMKALSAASEALKMLLQRISTVLDVIRETADSSVVTSSTDKINNSFVDRFLSLEEHKNIRRKLQELLVSICDYCNERLASIIGTHSDQRPLTSYQILQLSKTIETFTKFCEDISGKQSPALRAAFKIQAGNYINKFHLQRKNKLTILLDAERWKPAEIPLEFQTLVDKIALNSVIIELPSSPREENEKEFNTDNRVSNSLIVDNQHFVTIGTVLILLRIVCEYCVCAYELTLLAPVIGKNLAELLRMFNSRSCQLVLGAGALKTAGLKTITSTNLALTSRYERKKVNSAKKNLLKLFI
ncbi:hypothetical protein WA026_021441 [Henosepilachna vigintioctopunctata]|uniref:Vacuolar protein sorting-associated protein 54 n=1 Tax=Henosepilachna vigintioctopunctata TaxID=420089 RepID=A0AAW1U1F9_9CUCU